MKIYEGKRTIDGLVVTADAKQLSEHYEVKRFTTLALNGVTRVIRGNSRWQYWWIISVIRTALSGCQPRQRLAALRHRNRFCN